MFRSRVQFHGKAGHAGYIHDGNSVSAINELVYWCSKLNEFCNSETGTVVNVGKIEGGEKVNIVPDFAQMEFEVRYDTIEEYNRLLKLIDELENHASVTRVKIEILEQL